LLLYYITDRMQFSGTEAQRRQRLLDKISEASGARVDYIQLREKDLSGHDLECLAREAVNRVRHAGNSRLLINSRADVALAVGVDGVHLRSRDISPADVRRIWNQAQTPAVGVSCHSEAEVLQAEQADATFVVFGPVFEKRGGISDPTGLDSLRRACNRKIPILALGGVQKENARLCVAAGAAGVAGIRLFQENDVADVVRSLRGESVPGRQHP
jgi:thiamine-phosphate pyrophosphorylase